MNETFKITKPLVNIISEFEISRDTNSSIYNFVVYLNKDATYRYEVMIDGIEYFQEDVPSEHADFCDSVFNEFIEYPENFEDAEEIIELT